MTPAREKRKRLLIVARTSPKVVDIAGRRSRRTGNYGNVTPGIAIKRYRMPEINGFENGGTKKFPDSAGRVHTPVEGLNPAEA